jgi:hypothetical protein
VLFTWAILFVAIFFGFIAFMSILRAVLKLRKRDQPEPPLNVEFVMADLHEMLWKGQITPDEFEQLKRSLLQRDLLRARAREALMRDAEREGPPIGYAFEVIQKPPPLPPAAPPSPPPPPEDSSRDAR